MENVRYLIFVAVTSAFAAAFWIQQDSAIKAEAVREESRILFENRHKCSLIDWKELPFASDMYFSKFYSPKTNSCIVAGYYLWQRIDWGADLVILNLGTDRFLGGYDSKTEVAEFDIKLAELRSDNP